MKEHIASKDHSSQTRLNHLNCINLQPLQPAIMGFFRQLMDHRGSSEDHSAEDSPEVFEAMHLDFLRPVQLS